VERVIVAPRTPVPSTFAMLWANVLGTGEVGIHDNLFALGADSIDLNAGVPSLQSFRRRAGRSPA
jgi:hypothetical protein